jgi:hypothetical protein
VPERFDFAGTLPKLYIATVNKLLGGFLGGFVVGALKLNRARDAIIWCENIRSIVSHFGPLGSEAGHTFVSLSMP